MELETILYEVENGVALVTLNRPRALNSLSPQLIEDLDRAVEAARADEGVGAVIITGKPKFFAAGADLKEIQKVTSPVEANAFCSRVNEVLCKIENLEKPVIAAISGMALGGGCEVAMACDLRIAAEGTRFGQPEIKLGLIPGAGGTQRLPRLVGVGRAKELLYFGDPIDAQEAWRIGLVNRVVPGDKLMDEAKAMAAELVKRPPYALKLTKAVVNQGLAVDIKIGLGLEARAFESLFATQDQKEGLAAFLGKRTPVFKGK